MRTRTMGAVASLILTTFLASARAAEALPVETILIDTAQGARSFTVEVAANPLTQERGLMYRHDLPADAGMLFDFHESERVAFWMKDTPLPLDMLFIRADGTISTIAPNATPYSTSTIPSAEPVRAVLEINGGQADALGIKPGDHVCAPIFHNQD